MVKNAPTCNHCQYIEKIKQQVPVERWQLFDKLLIGNNGLSMLLVCTGLIGIFQILENFYRLGELIIEIVRNNWLG